VVADDRPGRERRRQRPWRIVIISVLGLLPLLIFVFRALL